MLHSFTPTPPDVETLRIFLTLPLYHEFANCRNYTKLHSPFALAVTNLSELPRKIVQQWWSAQSIVYFERLIWMYKSVVQELIQLCLQQSNRNHGLIRLLNSPHFVALDMLKLFFECNKMRSEKVPYEKFYVDLEGVDICYDFLKWAERVVSHSKISPKCYLINLILGTVWILPLQLLFYI